MANEQKENRINLEDLPQAQREVSPEEAKEVRGGGIVVVLEDVKVTSWSTSSDGGGIPSPQGDDDLLIAGPISHGHIK